MIGLRRGRKLLAATLAAAILLGAAPPPAIEEPKAETATEAPAAEGKVQEPRDQAEKIHTNKGIQPMTASEKEAFDRAVARPESQLLKSYIVGDYHTGKIYAAHNADAVVGLASTSKLMSVYCIFEAIDRGEIGIKDPVTIGHAAASMHGSTYKMKEGDVYTVEELVHAGMVVSGNDAMIALAEYIAGSQEAFVERMNNKAGELGLTHAHFTNCHGLTDYAKDDYNRATAREMFLLSRKLIHDYPTILQATGRMKLEEPGRNYLGHATNPLLGILQGIDGLKTGYTGIAGRCFIATGLTPKEGRMLPTRFIGVYMGAENDMDRYAAALKLSKRAMEHREVVLAEEGEEVGELKLENASPNRSPVFASKRLTYLKGPEEEIKRLVDFYDITPPHSKAEPVGQVRFLSGDREVGKCEVYLREDIKDPNPILKYRDLMADIFRAMERGA